MSRLATDQTFNSKSTKKTDEIISSQSQNLYSFQDIQNAFLYNLQIYFQQLLSTSLNIFTHSDKQLNIFAINIIKLIQTTIQQKFYNKINMFQTNINGITCQTYKIKLMAQKKKLTDDKSQYFQIIQENNNKILSQNIQLKYKNRQLKQTLFQLNNAYLQCKKCYQQQIQNLNSVIQAQNSLNQQKVQIFFSNNQDKQLYQTQHLNNNVVLFTKINDKKNQDLIEELYKNSKNQIIKTERTNINTELGQSQFQNKLIQENQYLKIKLNDLNINILNLKQKKYNLQSQIQKYKSQHLQVQQIIMKKNILIEKLMKRIQNGLQNIH